MKNENLLENITFYIGDCKKNIKVKFNEILNGFLESFKGALAECTFNSLTRNRHFYDVKTEKNIMPEMLPTFIATPKNKSQCDKVLKIVSVRTMLANLLHPMHFSSIQTTLKSFIEPIAQIPEIDL
jgi:hypothetical protein